VVVVMGHGRSHGMVVSSAGGPRGVVGSDRHGTPRAIIMSSIVRLFSMSPFAGVRSVLTQTRVRCAGHHQKSKIMIRVAPWHKLSPPLPCSRAAALHHLARYILVRPAMRLTKHAPATRRVSGGAPSSKDQYSMRHGYHLSSSCSGAERPSIAAPPPPPLQHRGDQTCSQHAPCLPPPLVTTATVSTRSMANATAASGTFNRIGVGTDTMPAPTQPLPRTKHTPLE